MKLNSFIKLIGVTVVILFVSLYITQMSGYYQYNESKKSALTDDAIERFENDVREGKKIIAKNYLVEEKNYNNKISQMGMKLSSIIEKGFNKAMNAIFNELNEAMNSDQ